MRRIMVDDGMAPEMAALIALHLRGMHDHSPPESVHALGLAALRSPDVTLWGLWEGPALLGCGALKRIEPGHGEIKSMRTAPDHLGHRVGTDILTHIIAEARRAGMRRISLETGTGAAFDAAHRLYRRFGFVDCGPFAHYREDPFSRYMTLALDP